MKRILIIIGLIIVAYFGVTIVNNGFVNEKLNFDISSYQNIQDKSNGLTMAINRYNTKNDTQYEALVTNLNGSIKKYKTSKARYEELIEELNSQGQLEQVIEEQVIYSKKKAYNIDYLQTIIGNYSDQEGLTLTLELKESEYVDPLASVKDFSVCDLRFLITGNYINLANFIQHLEENDDLAFEIRDFNMTKKEANFTVYGVRITNSSLLQMQGNQGENGTVNNSGGTTSPSGSTTNSWNTVTNSQTTQKPGTEKAF